ncbi:MAG TPA: hydrogenase/urease maturation nickel metallochaperone HypA [Candidatus Dormibacteraeota bacterium]
MHELGVAEGILSVVTDIAGERAVKRVVVRVGVGQSLVPDSLEFSFQLLAEGTVCEGASLQCVAAPGSVLLVDEIELDGDPPTVIRRPGSEVVEPPHEHPHTGSQGASPAPAIPAQAQGGA